MNVSASQSGCRESLSPEEKSPAESLVAPGTLVSLIRLDELVSPAPAVQRDTPLETVHRLLAQSEAGYFAVLAGDRPEGLGSRARLGILMGARFGFALHSQQPATEVLLPDPVVYCADDPVEPLLELALSRTGEAFQEDVILVDADGRYLGLVPTWRLAGLQTRLLAAQIQQSRQQQAALRQSNLEMFRKVAELHQSEARYRTLFSHSKTGFALLDADGRVASANPRLRELLGRPDDAELSLFAVLPQPARALFLSPGGATAEAEPPRPATEFTLDVAPRGERRLRLHHAWIPETGQWCVALDDITEERALQVRALEREKRSLLESLVGGVAHELNNKLAPIVGFASMLGGGATEREAAEYGELIGKSAAEAARIIQQLLNLSKPAQLQCTTFRLRELVAESFTLLRFRLRDAGVETQLPGAGDDVELHADAGQIRQVLLNLCVNAIDAMVGRPRRVLSVAIEAGPRAVRLVVGDTGTGIAAAHREKIFQPFFTTKGPNAGTGLGLSICAGIVEQHGGSITVRNRPEGGAEFAVCLPRLAAAGPTPRPAGELALPTRRLPLGGRVLVVDDEEVVARLVGEIVVRHFDCEVVRAANGSEALELCRAGEFAVVVSDLRMPVMNGLDFFQQLAAVRPAQVRRFVFMSGYEADLQYGERLAASGVTVLPKPFTPVELVARLRGFVQIG